MHLWPVLFEEIGIMVRVRSPPDIGVNLLGMDGQGIGVNRCTAIRAGKRAGRGP